MARPHSEGLDYFTHDVDASNDEKIEAMEALYGAAGYAFYFKMAERIYRAGGTLIISDAETKQILARKCLATPEEWSRMLASALKLGLFDAKIYEKDFTLTSNGIQKRCRKVFEKREKMAEKYLAKVSAAETSPETRQRKGKKSKEKKSKGKGAGKGIAPRFIPPTIDQVREYCRKRGNRVDPEKWIAHYESNGWRVGKNPMKKWQAAVITWEKNSGGFSGGRQDQTPGLQPDFVGVA